MTTWFTSDTHFGHRNILKYCNRPFTNVFDMNAKLIDKWNACVREIDTVYHLGDFSFLPEKQTREVLDCLNGNIKMIRGNHDRGQEFYGPKLELLGIQDTIIVDGQKLNLSHYPETFKDQEGLHLCGHIHTQWRSWQPRPETTIYNVGVDVWDFYPISFESIIIDSYFPVRRIMGEWKDPYHV